MGGGDDFGFYLPFNWRGFYDFGSSLIGDWGVHILGPANWALVLSPEYLVSVECIKKDALPPFTFPDVFTIKYEFKARKGMPPVTVYWYQHTGGDAVPAAGHDGRGGPQDPEHRPAGGAGAAAAGAAPARRGGRGRAVRQARRVRRGGGRSGRPRQAAGAAAQPQGSGYNCIFVGSKGYMGTSGRGEGVGLLPGERWADYTLPPQFLTRSPGTSARLDPRLQGRRAGVLELRDRRAVHRVAGARLGGRARRTASCSTTRRPACSPTARGQQVPEARLPQGLGSEGLAGDGGRRSA